jgi:lipoprotein-anchoring transpeptidase ErfK/SrfK
MKRLALLIAFAAAGAALSVATVAHAGSAHTATGTTTTSTTSTTTTTVLPNPNIPYVKKFPAAGELTVISIKVRRGPSETAKSFRVMHDFRPDYRRQEILAVDVQIDENGTPWYKISVPMRPNGTYGWIPAASADLKPTHSEIVVDRGARTIDVFRNNKHVVHAIVAVGAPGMETPLGHFYVAATFQPVNDPFLGVWALETSAYSKLTEWPGGGLVGIHGTNQPELLGQAVSHGCVRVSNATAAQLKRYAPVGTPIWIKA